MQENLDVAIIRAAVFGKLCGDPISWSAIATDWCGLQRTLKNRRIVFEALRKLTKQGVLRADYNWYGVTSLEATPAALEKLGIRPGRNEDSIDLRKESVMVNINGNVQNLNTGTVIGNMEATMKVLTQTGRENLEMEMKRLIGAIQQSTELSAEARCDVIKNLGLLSDQVVLPAEERNKSLLKTTMISLGIGLSTVGSLASIWSVCEPLLKAYFGF